MTGQTPEPAEPFSERVSETGPTEEIPAAPSAAAVEPSAPWASGEVTRNASADRAAVRAFRPSRVIPSVITAVVMTAIGVLVALEVISALVGHPLRLVPYDRMLTWASSTPWSDPRVRAGAGLVGLLGLLLVLFALIPGGPRWSR